MKVAARRTCLEAPHFLKPRAIAVDSWPMTSARKHRGIVPPDHGSALPGEAGFSIIEVLVAIILLVVGILGALVMIDSANGTTLANEARTSGVNLAREVAEGSRAVQETVPYTQLSDGCTAPSSPANPCPTSSLIVAALQTQPGLAPDATSPAGEWEITREDITYSLSVSVCAVDDPSDGYGIHATGGPFCSDVGAAGSEDTAPEDFQRLIVDVNWSGTRGSQNTRQVALLQSDGVNAPAVTCLRPTSSPCPASTTPLITAPATTSIPFSTTLSGTANRVVWYIDGSFEGTVTPSGTSAPFTWNLGTVGSGTEVFDGTYEVGATAFDINGKSGTTGSLLVQINRRRPVAPDNFLAGRNTFIVGNGSIGGVDLDWLPVPDKDVLYYRIYRKQGAAAPVMIKQTSGTSVTSYIDRTPPANPTIWSAPCANPRQAAASTLSYYVVAVDQQGGTPRNGLSTPSIEVNACNTAPKNPPVGALQLADNPDGTLSLSGSMPASPSDPDAGDQVSAVRIYRWTGSETPSDTVDRLDFVPVSGSSFSYNDLAPRPGGVEQKYCFTNVDTRMQESFCSNVVTG